MVVSPAAWPATAWVTEFEHGVELTYQADPGEVNNVTASVSAEGVMLTDLGATIVAGSGCNAVTPHEVQCRSVDFTDIVLDDLDDTATVSARSFNVLGGLGADTITSSFAQGGPGNDTLIGRPGRNSLDGGPGDDTLTGHEDADLLFPGGGNDVIDGGGDPGANDTVWMFDAPAPLTIDLQAGTSTGEGNDSLTRVESAVGSRFGDVFIGDAKANVFDGRAGSDVAFGGGGPDRLRGGDFSGGEDRLYGGFGNDLLRGSLGPNVLRGGPGHDRLQGLKGADILRGDRGRDGLEGGPGADYLRARDGWRDRVSGGRGVDRAQTDPIDAVTGVERL